MYDRNNVDERHWQGCPGCPACHAAERQWELVEERRYLAEFGPAR